MHGATIKIKVFFDVHKVITVQINTVVNLQSYLYVHWNVLIIYSENKNTAKLSDVPVGPSEDPMYL